MSLDFEAVDELFAREFAQGRSPGLVYAVVRDGEILHTGAHGTTRLGEETPPDVTSVQRIASMSKSFTASAILLLRDRGKLWLDDPVEAYVPEVADSGLTIRHLLTMSGGLLTDDPWGDRNESMTPAELTDFLRGGFPVGAVPGTVFEYANLGYALLGRVVEVLAGDYRRFVLEEITGPLGMTATAYDASTIGPALVPGHHKVSTGWVVQPQVAPGAFSAMGGLHSSVTDLARWVAGFTDAFRRPDAPHPLSAASRREMQQLQRFIEVSSSISLDPPAGGRALAGLATGYCFGLIAEHHTDHGQVVQHSGGYPGYGSHMRWHPETGLGIVALANGTYAGPVVTSRDALRALVAAERAPHVSPTASAALVARVTRWVAGERDDDLFTGNVALDMPAAERRTELDTARALVGELQPHGDPTVFADGHAFALWSVPAERGVYVLEIKVAPTPEPRVQWLSVTGVPDPPAELLDRARAVVRAVADGWPVDVPLAPGVDTATFTRAATVLRALGSGALLCDPVDGDGATTATWAVRAGTTWWRLALTAAPPAAPVTELTLTPIPTEEYAEFDVRFSR